MDKNTAGLIASLVAEGGPIKRLKPPTVRAGVWLLAVGMAGLIGVLAFADLSVFTSQIDGSAFAVEWFGTLLTGIVAVLAAFHLSLPDRSRGWAMLPLPFLAIWIGSSSYSCYRNWIIEGPTGWAVGESANCFMFIIAFSLPLGLSLLLMLRRAFPLDPVRVAAIGALGVAALAACALQFFHPFDVTFMDLGVHLGTVAVVVFGMSAIEFVRGNTSATHHRS